MKIIKTKQDYDDALAKADGLINLDPDIGTVEAEELELLALLVEDYEKRNFAIGLPDPIDAIEFRMDQLGLTQRDLVPYIGSRSRVSEVLGRKRPLTLAVIRALHKGLGIPANVLLQGEDPSKLDEIDLEWKRFPLGEMMSRGWLEASADGQSKSEELMRAFFAPLGPPSAIAALYRKSDHIRSARKLDEYALLAWTARVMLRARAVESVDVFKPIASDLLREVAKLSVFDTGPVLAGEFLKRHGIILVIERHLPHTQLDGAALLDSLNQPVIGLTLRYDRIDSFWFTLMHELAHLMIHMKAETTRFYDDLDIDSQSDLREQEADEVAGEVLIPKAQWEDSPARLLGHADAVNNLARKLGIHPAIVAGHWRHENKNYRQLGQLVGHGQVRKLFPGIDWGAN